MKTVECYLKRPEPPLVVLDDKKYQFKKDPSSGAHICEIENEAHAHHLVKRVPEAYRLFGEEAEPFELPKTPVSTEHPMQVAQRQKQEALAREQMDIERQKNPPKQIITNGETEIDLGPMSLEQLRALATGEFDIKVHPRWNEATLRAKIIEATRVEK